MEASEQAWQLLIRCKLLPLVYAQWKHQSCLRFLKDYFSKEKVELIIIGMPANLDDTDTHATPLVKNLVKQLQKNFPAIPVKEIDERFTSKIASQAMLQMGLKKMQRRNKALIDEIAATMMLQEYLSKF